MPCVDLTTSLSFEPRFCMVIIKDTYREKPPSNKTPSLTKSTNIGIWVAGTSNEPFIRIA